MKYGDPVQHVNTHESFIYCNEFDDTRCLVRCKDGRYQLQRRNDLIEDWDRIFIKKFFAWIKRII
jgi:hypothetical protein